MKRVLLWIVAMMLYGIVAAQNMGTPQPPSTYDQVDEMRNELNLDHLQFEKVYSAYDKYNKAVFGDKSDGMKMPPGGRRGPGNPPEGGRPGGGPGFGGGMPGGHPDFNGPRPEHPGNGPIKGMGPAPEDMQKMEKNRAKQEEKLVKSMKKIFKKDPATFEKWQQIRREQLKSMFRMPPVPGRDRPE